MNASQVINPHSPPVNDRLEALTADLPAEELALVSAAASLVPALSANAEAADAMGRLPDDDIAALRKEGLLRLATPRKYGGHEAGACAATAIAAEVGRGCPSASWVLTVYYTASIALWLFPDEVRDRVWDEDPDATVCGSSAGAAPARAIDGGYLLSGRWGWASGIHHASWAILSVVTEAGGTARESGFALVPTSELSVDHTWNMVGMRGTGSDTIIADDVFVPEDHVIFPSRMARQVPGASTPLSVPKPQGLMGALAAPVLGMGMGLYDHIVAKLSAGRPLVSATSSHARAIDSPGVQANIADAAMLIDSAILQAARTAHAVDRATRTGAPMSPLAIARSRMDCGFAARQIRLAADKLLDVGGAGRFAESDPAQRIWRDLGTATRHPAFVTEIDREQYARLLLPVLSAQ
ncbi:acyl-CoA dehydrogenase [Amycolatopsis mediterranei S699]|uniref:Acyl-CoA dehydrogenase n=2 Tax=Amycolatopsis mediterranei TaxID=33910 RepID=A0A0H3DG32_AMYMU|nr:acyl-CoA dehydrogenase family protein [Amycolatopsis mediterranei]ADJ49083.1 acyl-CoA dehydrogenase [Amycolatopsis mediterranei U32]AEK46043.1 acyl-CoA dehydrogenase [Amycolatopsis mediterranei S699]AFO80791.1 acyl-CoA dehydrogenase [Amycolatopsis mediterranei S699]AGT87919.1 acyl-CoA dehydrogenase [Amycolatopsis mediterranei RB]KDO04063.1 acyl-CoA dehydrogenase [Amycolatopsis mediterranei]